MPSVITNRLKPAPLHGYTVTTPTVGDKRVRYIDLPLSAARLSRNIGCSTVIACGANKAGVPTIFTGARIKYELFRTFKQMEAVLLELAAYMGIKPGRENSLKVEKPCELDVCEIAFEDRERIAGAELVMREVRGFADEVAGLGRNSWGQVTLGTDGYFFVGSSWTMSQPNNIYRSVEDFVQRAIEKAMAG